MYQTPYLVQILSLEITTFRILTKLLESIVREIIVYQKWPGQNQNNFSRLWYM